MHMADALISPAVGGTMLAVTAGVAAYSINKVKHEMDEKKIPLMGVMGAFVFAAQMINVSIPGTGSSGHLGGGMLLAILLGLRGISHHGIDFANPGIVFWGWRTPCLWLQCIQFRIFHVLYIISVYLQMAYPKGHKFKENLLEFDDIGCNRTSNGLL
ncbi:substrate-specific component NikM of nickel ECF transporter [Acetivibrio straminisolvens JCM 21531]|uniref:Substrate-specific component NikM of nickel ECF transporter n=1 Tax=Acetivibrio straminisolvens JCM 21531 TaxID=1294263 RepID=W4V8D6_9FIRM|nr:substrate-specific component NikM of nickel ECF transporter [Acetivibrio straminisolvens JCM 21531]